MMIQKFGNTSTICFICSPGLGILDNWLPIIFELREERPDVDFLFVLPKANSVGLIDPDNVLIKMAANIFDTILFRSYSGLWLHVDTFKEAQDINELTPLAFHLHTFARRVSRFDLFGLFSRFIYSVYKAVDLKRYSNKILKLEDICSSVKAVLFDVYEEAKDYNSDLMHALHGVPKFSICHGIDINSFPIVSRCPEPGKQNNIIAYLFSKYEKDYYKGTFCLDDSDLKVVGIPRHNIKWMEKIIREQKRISNELLWDDYIFIISRPLSQYFPYEKKRKALEDINRLAFKELNKRIVVKFHPKERDDGLYKKIFGAETYGKKWIYSNHHPFVLGEKCTFAISFLSGVVLDMLAMDVPVIEYLDLRGISEYDNHESLRDDSGDPVFSYRYFGVVLGASNYEQLLLHAHDIIENRSHVINGLKAQYNKKFPSHGYVSKTITSDILSFAKLVNENQNVPMKMRHTRQ